jgi:hypothetical protein
VQLLAAAPARTRWLELRSAPTAKPDAEEEEKANEVFSLNSIPPCHQFLDCTELEKFGQECVQQLLELFEKLLLPLHKLSPSKENAKENAADHEGNRRTPGQRERVRGSGRGCAVAQEAETVARGWCR